jgi:phytoene dehydrogenase-like protein
MASTSIIIIGAGVAGLSAGCYAQMNGYRSQIFKLHSLPGGLCTSWSRKGYTFDGCIHWLVGSGEKSGFRKIWDELGALKDKKIVNHEEYIRVVSPEGKTFILYTDPDRLEKHMLELSPTDAPVIKELTGGLRTAARVGMGTGTPHSLSELITFLKDLPSFFRLLGLMRKYSTVSVQAFATRFQDPFLRQAFLCLRFAGFPLAGRIHEPGLHGCPQRRLPGGWLSKIRSVYRTTLP